MDAVVVVFFVAFVAFVVSGQIGTRTDRGVVVLFISFNFAIFAGVGCHELVVEFGQQVFTDQIQQVGIADELGQVVDAAVARLGQIFFGHQGVNIDITDFAQLGHGGFDEVQQCTGYVARVVFGNVVSVIVVDQLVHVVVHDFAIQRAFGFGFGFGHVELVAQVFLVGEVLGFTDGVLRVVRISTTLHGSASGLGCNVQIRNAQRVGAHLDDRDDVTLIDVAAHVGGL